ncbi:MAG: hypothetical protein JNL98_16615 [Bryobacterales bacterium]|nr:hypothetical protein [Bryobacterales bacterium]
MRCLYCGKKLALLRKLTDSEFCSDTHRRLYQQEQEKMALARLVDAQQRFSRIVGPVPTTTEKANGKLNGKPKVNGVAHEPHFIAQDEEMRGFVPQMPAPRTMGGHRAIAFFPELNVNDPAIPPFEAVFSAEPRRAVRVDLTLGPVAHARHLLPVPFEWENAAKPVIPSSLLSVAGEIGVTCDQLASEPAGRVAVGWIFEPVAVSIAGMRAEPAEPVPFPSVSAGVPQPDLRLSGFALGMRVPMSAATLPCEVKPSAPKQAGVDPILEAGLPQGLDQLRRRLTADAAWQTSGSPVSSHPVASREDESPALEPVQPVSALPALEAAPPTGDSQPIAPRTESLHMPAPEAPAAGTRLFRLKPSERVHLRQLPMRKPRLREMFFPLPRLGGLPEMAGRVWRAANPRHRDPNQELPALSWIVKTVHNPQPVARQTTAWRDLPFQCALLPSLPAYLPVQAFHASSDCSLHQAHRVDMLLPVTSCGPSPVHHPMELPLEWMASREIACSPRTPESVAHMEVSLVSPGRQHALQASMATGQYAMRQMDTVPSAYDLMGYRMTPQSRAASPSFVLRQTSALATIEATSGLLAKAPLMVEDLAPCASDRDLVPIVCPVSHVAHDFYPAAKDRMVPLGYGTSSAVSMADLGPSYKDLKSLWPEPVRQLPRMRTSVVEDPAVREAVKAMPSAERSWRPNVTAKLPSLPAIQFSRLPDWKWVTFVVPALLLVALVTVFTPDSPEQTADLNEPGVEQGLEPSADSQQAAEKNLTASAKRPGAGKKMAPPTDAAVDPAPVASSDPAAIETAPAPVAEVLAAPVEGGAPKKANFLTASLNSFRQTLRKRAAISFSDDFRSGLAEWEGKGDWSKQWSYDGAGFVLTGPLALYRPSMSLSDYDMNLLAQVEKKSIGWVFRARDLGNYYATKITLTRGGPLPEAVVERYVVIDGKQSSYVRRPLPVQARVDTVYPISLNVKGSDFTLRVQGQVVDYWSDSRLKSGGVGLFSAKGEQARVRWIEVSHQYDTLGRLCAFLAPYSITGREGSSR